MATTLSTGHKTHVHHLALDPSCCLLASCSSDKTVRLFHRNLSPGTTGVWEPSCTISDHSGPVIRLAWCQHREHGPLLATVSADRWICVYRIIISKLEGSSSARAVRWTLVRGFEKDVITDVAFIPPQQYHVLLLSTASLDGSVRLYEVNQPPVCLHLQNDTGGRFRRSKGGRGHSKSSDIGITSLSWFPGASETTMTLAVGGVSGRVSLYKYVKDSQVFSPITSFPTSVRCSSPVVQLTWAFPVGRMFQLLAVCSKN
ncbi:nucleoporin SEH1 [Angomonas deanei]|nr:nucleoporin SEH1 [Angomonas deanei]|eukprot:EPY32393.1 nucleoporin SEH1 [Angomonas deanei]